MHILLLLSLALADERTHTYETGEEVILWFNKVSPFNNPQESYSYSKLPLCRGPRKEHLYAPGLGEAIEGNELIDSGMDLKFLENSPSQAFCTKKLSRGDVRVLMDAIKREFWIQLYMDDLPLWSELGKIDGASGDVYIFTHYFLVVSYNENSIIQARIQPEKLVRIYDNSAKAKTADSLQLSYSITWQFTETPFSRRFEAYLDPGFFENNIHWFSIINSLLMVLLLCGLVGLILFRTLSKDYARYAAQEFEPDVLVESSGWKQVAGEVLTPPAHLYIFTALYSTGWKLLGVMAMVLIACVIHPMYTERGSLTSLILVSYCLMGFLGGFTCGKFYTENNGKKWIGTTIVSMLLLPSVVFLFGTSLNTLALIYSSTAAVPFLNMLEILAMLVFIYGPLFLVGAVLGKRLGLKKGLSLKYNLVAPPILKEKKWYNEPAFLVLIGGLIPFGSVSVEIYFIFTSFWNYKFYYVYGFAILAFVLLVLSLVCVSIVCTYMVLNSEDYRWHWVSFMSSGSLGLYLYFYSCYYYLFKTKMTGYFQFAFYFGYTGLASFFLFLLAGAIGYAGSSFFVKQIYKNIKSD